MTEEFRLDKQDDFSILITKPSGRGVYNLRLGKWTVIVSLVLILVLIGGVSGGAYYAIKKELNTRHYQQLQENSKVQAAQIQQYATEMQAIKLKVKELYEKESEIQRMMGSKKNRSTKSKQKGRNAEYRAFDQKYRELADSDSNVTQKIDGYLALIKDELVDIEYSFHRVAKKVNVYIDRFASTPSMSPVFGRIRSDYGWRVHPKTGRAQFHKGIDIPSWYGAPVKSAADGVVMFSGWGGGYGWLVIIGHEYGYSTMYAHLSEMLVSHGMQVKKGEIIGKIGDTGITTGPHVHYEIRRWGKKHIDPKKYLELDLFTAVTQVW